MSILWRYLVVSFLRVFFLCVSSFILILLVSRFKDITRFAALSSGLSKTFLFVIYQIPLILPIAIPISSLIASVLLFGRLSKSFELTAFRSSGIGLFSLLSPILCIASLLSIGNFSLSATITPFCKRESKALLYYETTSNPLLLLQRQNLVRVQNSYLKMNVLEDGQSVKNFTLITHNQSNDRLSLVIAKKLKKIGKKLIGENVSVIFHSKANPESFDPLLIENQQKMTTDAAVLSSILKKKRPKLEISGLELPMLRIRFLEKAKFAKKISVEILRRSTLAVAVFTFTLLGCSFSISQPRTNSRKNLFIILILSILLMMSYLLGKECKAHVSLAFFIILIPHLVIWFFSINQIQKVTKGFV